LWFTHHAQKLLRLFHFLGWKSFLAFKFCLKEADTVLAYTLAWQLDRKHTLDKGYLQTILLKDGEK
jgi:hypothetical protein